MQMLHQNTCTDIGKGKYLQIVKFVFSKMKKVFIAGSLDEDTLMVQVRLPNLSHATFAPICSIISGCKGNASLQSCYQKVTGCREEGGGNTI